MELEASCRARNVLLQRFLNPLEPVLRPSREMPDQDLELLLAHRDFIRGVAMACLQNRADAEDVSQEAWVALLKHRHARPRSIRAWLATIVRNASRDMRRASAARERREHNSAPGDAAPSMEEILDREKARRAVVDAVAALEEPYRSTVLLRFFEELTLAEVAQRLDVPVETVRTRLRRALLQIREQLERKSGSGAWTALLLTLAPPAAVREAAGAALTPWAATAAGLGIVSTKVKFTTVVVALLLCCVAAWNYPFAASDPAGPVELLRGDVASIPDNPPPAPPPVAESARRTIETAPAAASKAAAESTARPGIVRIKTVFKDDGSPAPDAWISLGQIAQLYDPFSQQIQLRSDANGNCKELSLAAGKWGIRTLNLTDSNTYFEVGAGGPTAVTIRMTRGYTVLVRVVDDKGQAVPGAEVWAFSGQLVRTIFPGSGNGTIPTGEPELLKTSLNHCGVLLGVTDALGECNIPQVSYHQYLTAWKAGFAAASVNARTIGVLHAAELLKANPGSRPQAPPPGQPYGVVKLTITLGEPELEISGRVIDDYTKPVANATICTWPEDMNYFVPGQERPMSMAVTDANGKFTIRGLPRARFRVEARPLDAPDTTSGDIVASPWMTLVDTRDPKFETCEIRLPQGAVVSGVVSFEDGKPAAGVNVEAVLTNFEDGYFTRSTLTDAQGNYKLCGVVPNRVTLRAFIPATSAIDETTVELAPMQHFRRDCVLRRD